MGNRVALVTGGARGIGFGIALRLAQDGFDLAIAGRRTAEDDASRSRSYQRAWQRRSLRAGRRCRRLRARALLLAVEERFGRLDVLVNNAGIAPRVRADILEAREEHFDEVMAVNLKGPYFLTQAAAAWMIRQRESVGAAHRAIINIGSISATVASVNRGEYCLSKAGVAMATRLWAARLAEFGIGVYEVRPGIIESEMTAGVRAKYDALIESGLLVEKRWGTAGRRGERGERAGARRIAVCNRRGDRGGRRTDAGAAVTEEILDENADRRRSRRGAMAIRGCLGNPGLDSRCILLFHPHFSSSMRWPRDSRVSKGRDRLVDHRHAGHAAAGRAAAGRAGRPLRRRGPLIACVLFFSIVSAMTPFAPNYSAFLILRALYGVGMGGYWGIGASLVMESSPARWRGLFSGILQAGYSLGYLLAAAAMPLVVPRFGWQWVFLGGLLLAAPIVVLALLAAEPEAWQQQPAGGIWRGGARVWEHKGVFVVSGRC